MLSTFRRNRSCSANDLAYCYTFLYSVVCLLSVRFVVCHCRAPCLNRLMALNANWQLHLRGLKTHCVRWGPLGTSRKKEELPKLALNVHNIKIRNENNFPILRHPVQYNQSDFLTHHIICLRSWYIARYDAAIHTNCWTGTVVVF